MGERQNDGGPAGRRRVHPEGAPSGHIGPHPVTGGRRIVDAADLEALLAAALIRRDVDAGAEQRAVAVFLAVRESGAHGARTRRRDDWRTRKSRLGRHSLKATLSVVVAGLALSGVAVAGIGATGSSTDGPTEDDRRTHAPSPGTTGPSAGGAAGPGADAGADRSGLPGAAREAEAHCRAYEEVRRRGKALDAAAWKRLTEAAGGAANVDAYCAERLEGAVGTGGRPTDTRVPEEKGDDPADRPGNVPSEVPSGNATRNVGGGSGTANSGSGGGSGTAGGGSGGGSGAAGGGSGGGSGAAGNGSGGSTGKPGDPGVERP
ncbi:hypothetical protein KYY02_02140 [Streptomyces pimonensis]|uniref:Uncharacterized protein n=1 Tax=Streptomyces pimonensis TaxID=2860288 RepID=A0ABV4ISE3_9ACTN